MMNEGSSKKVLLSVLGVAILVVAVVGVSFAAFTFTNTNRGTNSIQSGTIAFTYSEPENALTIINAMPTLDQTGKGLNDYFQFTVSANATGAIVIPYEITFTPVAETSQLAATDVKIYLTDDTNAEVVAANTIDQFATAGTYRPAAKLIKADSFTFTDANAGTQQSRVYRLRMWLKDTAVVTGTARTYSLKVNVDAQK